MGDFAARRALREGRSRSQPRGDLPGPFEVSAGVTPTRGPRDGTCLESSSYHPLLRHLPFQRQSWWRECSRRTQEESFTLPMNFSHGNVSNLQRSRRTVWGLLTYFLHRGSPWSPGLSLSVPRAVHTCTPCPHVHPHSHPRAGAHAPWGRGRGILTRGLLSVCASCPAVLYHTGHNQGSSRSQ